MHRGARVKADTQQQYVPCSFPFATTLLQFCTHIWPYFGFLQRASTNNANTVFWHSWSLSEFTKPFHIDDLKPGTGGRQKDVWSSILILPRKKIEDQKDEGSSDLTTEQRWRLRVQAQCCSLGSPLQPLDVRPTGDHSNRAQAWSQLGSPAGLRKTSQCWGPTPRKLWLSQPLPRAHTGRQAGR